MRVLLFPFLLLALMACQSQQETNTFTYASSGEFKPFSYVDESGELQGYDIAVGREIARRLKREPKAVKYKFTGIVEGVKSGRFDAAVASHTITPEREKHVAFTIPYYYSGPQIFIRPNENISFDTIKGKNIAVSKGSTYAELAQKYTDKLSIYDSDITALEALNKGRHDLVITDAITGTMAIKRGLNIAMGEKIGESRQAIAVAKENKVLLTQINQTLKDMIADGTLKKISEQFFDRDISKSSEVSFSNKD